MKKLLKKYHNHTLSLEEEDTFVDELLKIRAQRMANAISQNTASPIPSEAKILTLHSFLKKVSSPQVWATAACLFMMCFAFWKLGFPGNSLDTELRAEVQNISKSFDNNETGMRGFNANPSQENAIIQAEKNAILSALVILKDKKPDYRQALAYLNDVKPDKYEQTITMLKVICHIQLKEKDEALKLLDTVTNANEFGGDDIRKANDWREFLGSL